MKTSIQVLLATLSLATTALAQPQGKIVYQDCVVGDCEISVINADGTNRVQLTHNDDDGLQLDFARGAPFLHVGALQPLRNALAVGASRELPLEEGYM